MVPRKGPPPSTGFRRYARPVSEDARLMANLRVHVVPGVLALANPPWQRDVWLNPSAFEDLDHVLQHAQWRRQGRREAYSEFIAAVAAHREATDRLMTLIEGTHRRDDASRALGRVDELFPAVRAASSVVTVEGPASVANLARSVMQGTGRVTSEVDFYVTVAHRSESPLHYEAGRVDAALAELSDLLGKFTEAARTALDSPKV